MIVGATCNWTMETSGRTPKSAVIAVPLMMDRVPISGSAGSDQEMSTGTATSGTTTASDWANPYSAVPRCIALTVNPPILDSGQYHEVLQAPFLSVTASAICLQVPSAASSR